MIKNSQDEQYQIQFVIEITGFKKKIRIRQVNQADQDAQFINIASGGNKIGISLQQLGISVISGSKNRKQILYLNFKKSQIILMQQNQIRKIQVKIKYFSIDNNSNHNTIYPVLLTPLKHQKVMTKSRPFFVMLIQTNINDENITEIKEFRICIESISLKIHDQVLVLLYDMYKDFTTEEKTNNMSDLDKLFLSSIKKYQWQQKQLKKQQNQIFFRQFEIAKLAIQLSFSIQPKFNKSNYLIFTILSSFGLAISNISESQLTLSRFLKKQVSLTQLKNDLSQFYVKQVIKGIYKILGSMTIFGNPYVFIRLLAQGAWQIVNQPTQGFIKGPIQGTIGIAKGGIYFTRNVVAGTFNSFQSISQSLSRGISYMTMDQKFIQRRQKIKMQKSNHLFQGFANGMFALYTGFQVAFTGLVRHPVQGYRKDGIEAGITGALKGVAGLVTKPISGLFQGISKISEGIKNTALLFQDGPNTKRARHPRVFLSHQKYYSTYNHLQSYTIAFLQHLSTKYLNIQILFISVTQNIQQSIMKSLLLTNKYLLIVDLVQKVVETEISLTHIQTIQLEEETKLRITTKNDEEIEIQDQKKVSGTYTGFQIAQALFRRCTFLKQLIYLFILK